MPHSQDRDQTSRSNCGVKGGHIRFINPHIPAACDLDQVMELRLRSKYTFFIVHVAIFESSMKGLHWLVRVGRAWGVVQLKGAEVEVNGKRWQRTKRPQH